MKKKRLLFLGIGLILIIGVSFYVFNHSSRELTGSQKEAALTKILGRKPNLTNSLPKKDLLYKGHFLTFSYPGDAKIYTPRLNGKVMPKEAIESLIFDLDAPKMSFYMEVDSMPKSVQSVSDAPGVRLREAQINIYTQKEITIDNLKGLVFEKQDITGFEETVFFFKDGKVFSFSFQGADKIAVGDFYQKLMSTVKFLP